MVWRKFAEPDQQYGTVSAIGAKKAAPAASGPVAAAVNRFVEAAASTAAATKCSYYRYSSCHQRYSNCLQIQQMLHKTGQCTVTWNHQGGSGLSQDVNMLE